VLGLQCGRQHLRQLPFVLHDQHAHHLACYRAIPGSTLTFVSGSSAARAIRGDRQKPAAKKACAKAGSPIGILDSAENLYVAAGLKDHCADDLHRLVELTSGSVYRSEFDLLAAASAFTVHSPDSAH